MNPHRIEGHNAPLIASWLAERGGLAIWRSVNLSNPGASWTTPVNNADGTPVTKPTWEADDKPERIITDPSEVEVETLKEVKRFHVAIRRGSQGFSFKLTDASTQKVRTACDKAGKDSTYHFDYGTQEAVISVPSSVIPLTEYLKGVSE